jgi:hypothetical protein
LIKKISNSVICVTICETDLQNVGDGLAVRTRDEWVQDVHADQQRLGAFLGRAAEFEGVCGYFLVKRPVLDARKALAVEPVAFLQHFASLFTWLQTVDGTVVFCYHFTFGDGLDGSYDDGISDEVPGKDQNEKLHNVTAGE